MKQYPIRQYTAQEWDSLTDESVYADNTIDIVWSNGKVSMDIQATGKRIVPILRKIEKSMTEAGLAGEEGIYAGWFGSWADSLTDSFDKRYFIWNYDGKQDRENGCWSYSWGIEQIDEERWYVFLNLATASTLPQRQMW